MSRFNKPAFLILMMSFILLGTGLLLAVNSCAKSEVTFPDEGDKDNHVSNGFESSPKHYPGLETVTLPESLASQIKEYVGFTVSFNKDHHTPNYVAWELLGKEVSTGVDRSDNFWQDPDIEGCPRHSDYTRSGYDRGHMCPAADQKWSVEAMNDCFVMANICPQDHQLNAGAWNTLENKERQWAQRDSAIMIVAGPIYDVTDTKVIGPINVRVPGAFFKAILAPYVDEPRAIAFVYPNMTSPGNMESYAMSVDDLEEILGYDLFPALPDDLEKKVEAEFSFIEWNNSK